ncbi:MutT/NUDIX family protein [Planococcus sp. PAMC 21323]|uniref:NUDIX domain-containing protein n=1 Tax=Planococcus sp. PAMC 21323 TaxID=1526927 RepID=UPI00056F11EF|nr:NUDIX domain-containing protein [Planococcus sp. PAMC 21323]AIY05457.1 MutT/NUDIX family protein [Planococcus sp. PAMC 21323]
MHIRNSAKAVIHKEGHVLLTKNKDAEGFFYLFPGGGQEHGEVLVDTIKRECLEETGYQVAAGDLLYVREYIGKNHEHAHDRDFHQIEFYFVCTIEAGSVEIPVPTNPDSHQIGIEWVAISKLPELRMYPKEIGVPIQQFAENQKAAVYLGDIN